ncbi:hypothetical protein [Williamsia soli]|uniref:hypothetical protein n=1 Tax=Williamsia soli TaxID=364929 RepID=UPI001A9DA3BC|nr:hypothetical protein [Williamsia soli]
MTAVAPSQGRTSASWLRRLALVAIAALALVVVAPALPTPLTGAGTARAVDACDVVGAVVGAVVPGAGDETCDAVGDVAGAVTDPGGTIKEAANDGFKSMTESLLTGFSTMLQKSLTWFIELPTPKAQQWEPVQKIQEWTLQIQILGLVISIIAGGIRLQLARKQQIYAEGEELFHSLMRAVFGAWMFGAMMIGLTAGVDRISTKLLELGASGEAPVNMAKNMFQTGPMLGQLGVGLMFVIAIIGILGAVLQAIILVARQSMLIVVVSILPIIGAASGTKIGKNAFSKTISWTIALLLWKPVAALTYAVAFQLAGTGSEDGTQILYGVLLLSLAAAVLPMLTKLVSGGMAMSGGSGLQAAAMTMGVVAAVGGLAATGGASAGAGAGAGAGTGVGAGGPTAGQAGAGGGSTGGGGVTRGGGDSGGGGGGGGGGGAPDGGQGGPPAGGRSTPPPPSATSGSGTEASPAGGGNSSGSTSSGGPGGGGGGSTVSEAMSTVSSSMQMSQAAEDFFNEEAPAMAGDPR